MKKKLLIIFTLIFLALAGFVTFFVLKSKKNNEEGVTSIVSTLYTETKDGVFYVYTSYGYDVEFKLRYIDYSSNKDVVVCDKPNCKHGDEDCNGYYGALSNNNFITSLFDYKDKLYITYIENDTNIAGVSSVTLYEQDFSGNNRKALFTTDHELVQDYVIADGVLYYFTAYCDKEYMKQFEDRTDMMSLTQEESDGIESHQCSSLWAYDFETGKNYAVIEEFGEYNCNLGGIGIIPYVEEDSETKNTDGFYLYQEINGDNGFENTVFYYYNYKDNECEENVFPEIADYNIRNATAQCIYENRYYFFSKRDNEYLQLCYDIDSKACDILAYCDETLEASLMDNKIIYNMGYGTEKTDEFREYKRYAYYDLKNGEYYVLNDEAPLPKYSSGDRGIIDYTDYYAIDYEGEVIDKYKYTTVDMNEYFENNYHIMEAEDIGIHIRN